MYTATLNQLSLACVDFILWFYYITHINTPTTYIIYMEGAKKNLKREKKKHNNSMLASLYKSLYISITLGSAIHQPKALLPLLFVSLLCWHVTRQDTVSDAVPPFLIGWPHSSGRGFLSRI